MPLHNIKWINKFSKYDVKDKGIHKKIDKINKIIAKSTLI